MDNQQLSHYLNGIGFENERWKTFVGDSNYEVSDYGNIRHWKSKKIRKLNFDRYGYLRITLYPSWKSYTVHRIVGMTWLEDTYSPNLQIDHLNSIRFDNRVENLEWVTAQENVRRIEKVGLLGVDNPMSSLTEEEVLFAKYSFGITTLDISKELGVNRNVIECIRRREYYQNIIDPLKEELFASGKVSYVRGHTANMLKDESDALISDLLSGTFTTKELVEKYNVSKSTVCRKRKILINSGKFNDHPEKE